MFANCETWAWVGGQGCSHKLCAKLKGCVWKTRHQVVDAGSGKIGEDNFECTQLVWSQFSLLGLDISNESLRVGVHSNRGHEGFGRQLLKDSPVTVVAIEQL